MPQAAGAQLLLAKELLCGDNAKLDTQPTEAAAHASSAQLQQACAVATCQLEKPGCKRVILQVMHA
jgi:hypothetical protein